MSILKIGVTGNIGAGKTQVCQIFELLGIPVYYADPRARSLMTEDKDLIDQIKSLFGEKAYFMDGQLNRKFIATIVFKDQMQLEKLNALVHPAVGKDFDRWALKQNNIYCIKEAALLFESGSYLELDKTILVVAETQKRIDRVVARDGFSREEVLSRMDKQMPQEIKLKMADYIIDNNGDTGLVNQVLTIHKTLLTL